MQKEDLLKDKNSFSKKLCVTYETLCWAMLTIILPMLLMWHYTTQWSPGKSSPLLGTNHCATPVVS